MSVSSLVNRRDLDFILYDLLQVERLTVLARWSDHSRETFDAAIEAAHRLALEKFAPHNALADRNEPHFDGERVHMIPEVAAALDAYRAAGFMAASKDYEMGGMQLPWTVAQAIAALFQAANISTAGYPFLTVAAANLIESFGSQEQKGLWLPPMLQGRFFGTMCLSEPQAGSGLAEIRTRAEAAGDGTWRIVGNKMWISAGEHELSENIVHMVLARMAGAPPGVKGISLFIVPKFLLDDQGRIGRRNDVRLAGLNHKMGYRGTTNTVLNFGEAGGAVGYLVGAPHRGLDYMFQMMNEARIGVGQGAVMLAYAAFLFSLDYARQRRQGRTPDQRDASQPPVPIIEHADVRRMLLYQKAIAEGGLHLCLYAANLVDRTQAAASAEEKAGLALLLDTLTPVVKGWISQACLKSNEHAIQILGGYGYTRDFPVEQYYRDQRLNPIHEGTDGIQAIDLLGRKMTQKGGAGWQLLQAEIAAEIGRCAGLPELAGEAARLAEALRRVAEVRALLVAEIGRGRAGLALANASYFLDLVGLVVMGWLWLWQARTALALAPASGDAEGRAFLEGKLRTCRYFMRYELARAGGLADLLGQLDDTTTGMDSELFG